MIALLSSNTMEFEYEATAPLLIEERCEGLKNFKLNRNAFDLPNHTKRPFEITL